MKIEKMLLSGLKWKSFSYAQNLSKRHVAILKPTNEQEKCINSVYKKDQYHLNTMVLVS